MRAWLFAVIGAVVVGVLGAVAHIDALIFAAFVGGLFLLGRWLDYRDVRWRHKFEIGAATEEIERLRDELDEERRRREEAEGALRSRSSDSN